MVKDTEQAIDAETAPAVHVAGSARSHKDVDTFVLSPHGWNPRLADIRHQGADGTSGIVVVCGIHPSLSETVTAVVVLTDEASNRPNERQLVFVGQGVDMAGGIINIAAGIGTPSGFLSVVGIVDDAHAAIDIGRDGG